MALFADLTSQGTEKVSSSVLENSHQIATSQAVLFGISGRNTDTVNGVFVMIFDKASAPVSGTDTPVLVISVAPASAAGNGNISLPALPVYGIKFKNGIHILGSSTDFNGSTFTVLTSNKLFFNAQYASEDGVTSPA